MILPLEAGPEDTKPEDTKPEETKPEEPEEAEENPLHIGNLISITSEAYGVTKGRVVYRSLEMVRIMPEESSDRAVEFPMIEDGSAFAPELGVTNIDLYDTFQSDYYVDFLGARVGEILEFFTIDGAEAAPIGEVAEVIKTTSKDSIKLKDGRTLKFRGIGPEPPIAVIRVRSAINAASIAKEIEEQTPEQIEAAAAIAKRKADMAALLQSVLPIAAAEPVTARSYPESMQREDMFQDLLADISEKKRTNPRRIRLIEREVDLALALKNKSVLRSKTGAILGPTKYRIDTIQDAIQGAVPAAIPIVEAARVLNIDDVKSGTYKSIDVAPRLLNVVEYESEDYAKLYLEKALPSSIGTGFYAYTYDLLGRGQATLQGPVGEAEWTVDQDVIRTAGLGSPVQGLSSRLPSGDKGNLTKYADVSPGFLISDVTDRSIRVLSTDRVRNAKGEDALIAPLDPSVVKGYMILPPKAALSLRPPTQPGSLPLALLYSSALTDHNLPTIATALSDLYSSESGSPLNVWLLSPENAGQSPVADWLKTVLKYAIHPADSLGPRSERLLSLLDTLGLAVTDLSPSVSDVIWSWVAESQNTWRTLLKARRAEIQKALDAEEPRTYQSVTGADATLWTALKEADTLKDLIEDIQRRNPAISEAPTLITASLLTEAQGDATPLVWSEIVRLDARPPMEGIDVKQAADSLATSREYILRRKILRSLPILALSAAAPQKSTCPHAARLEAIRNVRDTLTQSRLLRDFVEEFQGGKSGDWMTCVLCKEPCVCYHELMELEALAQPARRDAIQRQILIKFGGDRYEGKIICRNCGQPLQDIDYDEGEEFDDDGNRVISSSVLTEDQLLDVGNTAWKKAVAELAPPVVTFATQAQRDLGDALTVIAERGGLVVNPDTIRQIVRQADLYVTLRAPPPAAYEAQRTKLLTAASTKIKTATGVTGAVVDVPTYAALLDQLRVSSLTALTAIALQTAEPPITVNNPLPLCTFSRGGYPFDPSAKPDEPGALLYIACVVASIQRDSVPWKHLTWAGETKLESRKKQVLKVAITATQIILGADPKSAPLSFTPEVRQALTRAQTDVVAQQERTKVSLKDQLPSSFRPEPFPPTLDPPTLEGDPLPALRKAIAEGSVVAAPVESAMRQQAIAIIGSLHKEATVSIKAGIAVGKIPTMDDVCCPVPVSESITLQGPPEQTRLLAAHDLLRLSNPSAVNTGTHLWPVFEIPLSENVEQTVEEGVFFKLFLKYCYRGPTVGKSHEFSTGRICRQCGFVLGEPLEPIDMSQKKAEELYEKRTLQHGRDTLAAQQGDLRIEVTKVAFEALTEAVRRRLILTAIPARTRAPWISALSELLVTQKEDGFVTALKSVLAEAETVTAPLDEIGRASLWEPISLYMTGLRTEVANKIGPTTAVGTGKEEVARAKEATTALSMFDTITEDPFIEGPRALQEYWSAKVEAAAVDHSIQKATGATWANLSAKHNEIMEKLLTSNSLWYGGKITEGMRPVLARVAASISPLLRTWIRFVRADPTSSVWTVQEAQLVLRTIVLQGWRDGIITSSPMYSDIASAVERETIARDMANWTRALMFHVKQQFVKFSKDTIKRVLQDRASLDRETIVQEFESIKDDDERAAQLMLKQFRIGRWAIGTNFQKYDADLFDFETDQRHRMGIVDAPVDPILLEGSGGPRPAAAEDYGFNLSNAPEDGYDANQAADGDDY